MWRSWGLVILNVFVALASPATGSTELAQSGEPPVSTAKSTTIDSEYPAASIRERMRGQGSSSEATAVVRRLLRGSNVDRQPPVGSEIQQAADFLLDYIEISEANGALVDLESLVVVDLEPGVVAVFDSAGVAPDVRRRLTVRTEDDGRGVVLAEQLAVGVSGEEKRSVGSGLALSVPLSSGFAQATLVAAGNGAYVVGSRGSIWANWYKYRDYAERDPAADYYAYRRKMVANPTASTYVDTMDLQASVTDGSAWKVIAKTDWEPSSTISQGGNACATESFGVSLHAVGLSFSNTVCDEIQPNWLWGGLWTRYSAEQHIWEQVSCAFGGPCWNGHVNKTVDNVFQVVVKVVPGTVPYWNDYADANFCDSQFAWQCTETGGGW